jgi:hypothetical protein
MDEFRKVNLTNLHKLFLKDCAIHTLHKEAFRGLAILIELYLSGNYIHSLHPSVFHDNVRLRILSLSRNPIEKLEDGLFSNMTHLQTVDLSGCRLSHIGRKTFVNTPILRNLVLDGNNLTTMKVDTLVHLNVLAGLVLHNNPWVCDCHLKEFRDWIVHSGLYAQPTSCAEPPILNGKHWSDLNSDDLACKPQILFPAAGTTVEVDGGNVTLVCQVQGNPMPDVNWVFSSRIIGNYSSRTYGDQRYLVTESTDKTRWVNLTVTNVRKQDRGDYTCVAKSGGGVDERNVHLLVNYQPGAGGVAGDTRTVTGQWALIIGLVVGLVVLFAVALSATFFFCKRRGSSSSKSYGTKKTASDGILSSNGDIGGYTGSSEQEKNLLTKVNPVQKPPRRHERSPAASTGTEPTEVKSILLDNGSVFYGDGSTVASEERLEDRSIDSRDTAPQQQSQDGQDDDSGHLDSTHTYPPDLLSFPSPAYQVSPAGSTASTAPDSTHLPAQHGPQSPVHSPIYHGHPGISGTLPYSRSHSPFSPVVLPRQGYVTIPRRPRVPSWSSAPTPTPMGDPAFRFEPVYDNLGPRTTADGSSVLSLNKSTTSDPASQASSSVRGRPLPPTPNYHNNALPAFYAPIEEQEVQPSPVLPRANPSTRGSLRRSTPNINMTPSASPALQVSTSSRASKPDKADPSHRDSWTARSAPEGASLKRREEEPGTASKRNSLAASPPGATLPNGLSREAKVPPKPPPKPKKKSTDTVTRPLFEDEGEDGTEV